MGECITIDGSHGEGGGQLLRTAVTLSAITGRALLIEHIRAGRRKPGLAAQHLTAVLSVAKLCEAEVSGATLSSETLSFQPKVRPQPGNYEFDVAKAREGGSAGAATLVLQAVALAAVLAEGTCRLRIGGGTHPVSLVCKHCGNIFGMVFTSHRRRHRSSPPAPHALPKL